MSLLRRAVRSFFPVSKGNLGKYYTGFLSKNPRVFVKNLVPVNNAPTHKYFCFRTTFNRNIKCKTVLLAGVMSFLGLQKEEENEDPLIYTIKLGILSFQKGDFDTAETILHNALKIAQERLDTQGETYIFDMLANIAFQKGDFSKAEKLFKEVMSRILASGTEEDDNAIVEMSLKLASIYSHKKDDVKAEEGFSFCLKSQEKKMQSINMSAVQDLSELEKDTIILWAMGVDWYAHHLLDRGRLKEAQKYFEKAYEISEKINGATHDQTLVLLNDIAGVASMRKDYDTALKYFQLAIDRGKVSRTPDLPAFYCNLGATYLHKGSLEEAREACLKALSVARNFNHRIAIDDAEGCLKELSKLLKAAA